MDEFVSWLNDCLDEDERIARAVRVPHEWHQGPGDDDPEWVGDEMVLMWPPEFHTPYEQDKHWRGLTAPGEGLAAFIAAHDPARVLREIDAKRATIRMYVEAVEFVDSMKERGIDATHYKVAAESYLNVMRNDAAVYDQRPGYAEAVASLG